MQTVDDYWSRSLDNKEHSITKNMIYHEEKQSFLEKITKIRDKSHEKRAY
jgi:hypothetical protein